MAYYRCGVCSTNSTTGVRSCSYRWVTKRFFYTRCPKVSTLCSALRGAYVPSITVCRQQLFTGSEPTSDPSSS